MKQGMIGAHLRRTKRDFEVYLNRHSPDNDSVKWLIGGTMRRPNGNYGTLLRAHAKVLFNKAFKEWSKHKIAR